MTLLGVNGSNIEGTYTHGGGLLPAGMDTFVRFNGSGLTGSATCQSLNFGPLFINPTKGFSVTAVFKLIGPIQTEQRIFEFVSTAYTGRYINFGRSGTTKRLRLGFNSIALLFHQYTADMLFEQEQVYRVGISVTFGTSGNGTYSLYVDGQLSQQWTVNLIFYPFVSTVSYISRGYFSNGCNTMDVYHLRYYQRVLTAEEILLATANTTTSVVGNSASSTLASTTQLIQSLTTAGNTSLLKACHRISY